MYYRNPIVTTVYSSVAFPHEAIFRISTGVLCTPLHMQDSCASPLEKYRRVITEP